MYRTSKKLWEEQRNSDRKSHGEVARAEAGQLPSTHGTSVPTPARDREQQLKHSARRSQGEVGLTDESS